MKFKLDENFGQRCIEVLTAAEMKDKIPSARALAQPSRAKENSPPIPRWVFGRVFVPSPEGRKNRVVKHFLSPLTGLAMFVAR